MQSPPAVVKLLSTPMLYDVPFTRHRPQKVEIGTVLGLSPTDAMLGYELWDSLYGASV